MGKTLLSAVWIEVKAKVEKSLGLVEIGNESVLSICRVAHCLKPEIEVSLPNHERRLKEMSAHPCLDEIYMKV